jgi:hypothetical protein
MRLKARRGFVYLLGLCLILAAQLAIACDNPVFRYALENWAPANFQLVLITDQPLSEAENAAWKQIEQRASASEARPNLQLKKIERAQLNSELGSLAAKLESTTGNVLALISPDAPLGRQLVWTGPLTAAAIEQLIDSPQRQVLAERLIDGEAIVWVMLESADADANEQMHNMLDTFLSNYLETIIATEAAEAANPTAPPVDASAKPASAVDKSVFWPPKFSTLPIRLGDDREELLVKMLQQTMPGELVTEPVVFPVFGRGRVLGGLPLSRLNPQLLRSACDFLTGACSCEVKERNPGDDLLMAAAWETVPKATAPTGLISLLELDTEPQPTTTETPAAPITEPAANPTTENEAPANKSEDNPPQAATPIVEPTTNQTAITPPAPAPTTAQAPTPITQPPSKAPGMIVSPILIFGGILAAIILVALFGMRR